MGDQQILDNIDELMRDKIDLKQEIDEKEKEIMELLLLLILDKQG